MSEFKEFKIKIDNVEHNKEVQDVLFALGYEWFNHVTEFSYSDCKYLYTTICGGLFSDDSREFFEDDQNELVTLAKLKSLVKLEKMLPEADKPLEGNQNMTEFKEFKIKIDNAAHNIEVQNTLFALGYSWVMRGNVVTYPNCNYLYTDCAGYLSCGDSREVFEEEQNELVTLYGLKSLLLKQSCAELFQAVFTMEKDPTSLAEDKNHKDGCTCSDCNCDASKQSVYSMVTITVRFETDSNNQNELFESACAKIEDGRSLSDGELSTAYKYLTSAQNEILEDLNWITKEAKERGLIYS